MDEAGELRAAERALQAAIIADDVDALEVLLDDRLVHVSADGSPQLKRDLIAARAAGLMRIRRLDEEALEVIVEGTTGVTRVAMLITGYADGMLHAWRVVATRTWTRHRGTWAVLAEHVSLAEPRTGVAPGDDEPPGPPRLVRVR